MLCALPPDDEASPELDGPEPEEELDDGAEGPEDDVSPLTLSFACRLGQGEFPLLIGERKRNSPIV